MVIAGSLGLHHVVPDVSVVNDLVPVDLGPLATHLLRHRLDDYYGKDAALARHMLDAYAMSEGVLTVNELLSRLAVVDLSSRPTRDEAVDLIRRLEADHYLTRVGNGDRFASALLRTAWTYRRRLP